QIVDLLSGSPLAFDAAGNLLVGGGDLFGSGDGDYFAIVRSTAVASALAGGGQINAADTNKVLKPDPDVASNSNFYAVAANRARTEIYAVDFGATTAYVYRPIAASVPDAPVWARSAIALLLLAMAALARSRQRSA